MDGGGDGRSGLARERLEELVERGMTITEIAFTTGMSKGAVRHWLGRWGLRTHGSRRLAAQREAAEEARTTMTRTCRVHGETTFVLDREGVYRCRRCRVDAVTRRRRKVKRILVEEAGGCCALCGYNRCMGALSFHHVRPEDKTLAVSMSGVTLALDYLREEARKCVLLCANCHAEVEGGVVELTIDSDPSPID